MIAREPLKVTGAVTIGTITSGTGIQKNINVGAGSLTCASIALGSTHAGTSDNEIRISTGIVTVSGNIVMSGVAARNAIRFSDAGLLKVGGNLGGGSIGGSPGTVELYGDGNTAELDTN